MVSYFYPRPPRGGRRGAGFPDNAVVQFLSTPSARRATVPRLSGFVEVTISIHALREEGDSALHTRLRCAGTISIHALREEGDNRVCCSQTDDGDFYPRPPRGGRRGRRRTRRRLDKFLSTPSARRATGARHTGPLRVDISIHALREEGDLVCLTCPLYALLFLSTPSARRATGRFLFFAQSLVISIHALREEGDASTLGLYLLMQISIHALREEGDGWNRSTRPSES